MEKDLHNDRLEDYVKKSFEDYEEIPPADMWERVADALPAQEPVRRPLALLFSYKWQIAAASVILVLVSRLLFVQSYYEQQLRSMAAKNEVHSGDNQLSAGISGAGMATTAPARPNIKVPPVITGNDFAGSQPSAIQSAGMAQVAPETIKPASESVDNELINSDIVLSRDDSKTVQQVFSQPAAFSTGLALLPPVELSPLATSKSVSIPPAAAPPVKPVGGGRKWYWLAAVAPGRIAERHMRAHPGGPGSVFASRSETPETTTSFSLRRGRAVNRKIALEGGLAYQEMTRQTIHKPRFQFREGQTIPGGGGHHPEARSFQYDLNTYGGSASVTLRADVVGGNVPGENERVEAVIRSVEEVQLLQIPLTVAARIGEGRVSGIARAGVVGNCLIRNRFDVTAYQMDTPDLQPQSDNAYTVEFHAPRRFFPGFQVALGAEYRVSEKISVSAFPVITGDFPRKDYFRGGNLPGQATLAFAAAASYWF